MTALLLPMTAAAEVQEFDSGTKRVALVELFTSQGCNSCPPAERWLGELQNDPRLWRELVPIAFHVDYWDGLGWRDQFASPAFSQRQRQYRREGQVGSVYTPGFVVDGREWQGWFRRGPLPAPASSLGRLTLNLKGEKVGANYSGASSSRLKLHLAVLGVGIRSHIGAGENTGKTLPQDFTVLGYAAVESDQPQWQTRLPRYAAPEGARLALAAWVSLPNSQVPLQAVGGWLE